MNRYQIYLDAETVSIFDDIAEIIKTSRSHIIRDVTDRAAREFEKLLVKAQVTKMKSNPLLKMAGAAKGVTRKASQNIHEIYLVD